MSKEYDPTQDRPNKILKKKYAQDDDWIRELLERAVVGHVASSWDDQPFITPIVFWYDADSQDIFFHTNIVGRLRANSERHELVCFEAFEVGKPLPSNIALNFSIQYKSVVAFGRIRIIEDHEEQVRALDKLISKYFPGMEPGEEYRPITDQELSCTTVFAIRVDSWSGKQNWKNQAEQGMDWPQLDEVWFE